MPSTVTSLPSPRSIKSSAWSPVLWVASGFTSCGIEVVGKRRLAAQATRRGATALAREACSRHAEAIGFTVERAFVAAEVEHA